MSRQYEKVVMATAESCSSEHGTWQKFRKAGKINLAELYAINTTIDSDGRRRKEREFFAVMVPSPCRLIFPEFFYSYARAEIRLGVVKI
jgi:hypothetical protein